jgi:hypothetical protein
VRASLSAASTDSVPLLLKKRILQIARREQRERLGEHGAQRIEQILAVQRLAFELRAHRAHHLGMTVPDVEDAEAAQAVDVFAAVHVGEDVAGVAPLDGGIERSLRAGLAIFEETRVDVVAKAVDGFADDPIGLRAIDRRGVDDV